MSLSDLFNIKQREDVHTWKGEPVKWVHEKKNGYRVTLLRGRTMDDVRVIPRKPELDYWPRLRLRRELYDRVEMLPVNTVLDGELYVPGRQASDVPTALNDTLLRLELCPFAVPVYGGKPCNPSQSLEAVSVELERLGWRTPRLEAAKPETTEEDYIRLAKERGWEGFVLKQGHLHGWFKVKPQRTIDAVVIRHTLSESDTKWGMLKAVVVGLYRDGELVEIASVGGGFTDEQREALSHEDLRGRVCEVEYQDVLSRGRLQFPRFVRWRDDKPAGECLYEHL